MTSVLKPIAAVSKLEFEDELARSFGVAPANAERADPTAAEIEEFGQQWRVANSKLVATFPRGTMIAVDFATRAYVTAATGVEVMDKFEAAFGKSAWAWVDEIGVPIKVGADCGHSPRERRFSPPPARAHRTRRWT